MKEALFTRLMREKKDDIHKILGSDSDIVEKVVILRRMAREIAKKYFTIINYKNLAHFHNDYVAGNSPLTELEGPGFLSRDLTILKSCPSATLFDDFKVNGDFPDYWTKIPQQFMEKFRNESILHPLCIVHQTFRDQLTGRIPKGNGVVHSIAVACRSGTGKVVYSDHGLYHARMTRDDIDRVIDGYACAFQLR